MITEGTMRLSATNGDSLSNRAAGTFWAANSFDFQTGVKELGEGSDIYVVFSLPKAVLGTATLTVAFEVIGTTNGVTDNPTVLATTGPIPINTAVSTTNLKAGSWALRIQPSALAGALVGGTTARSWLTARYVVAGTGNTVVDADCVVRVDVALDISSMTRYFPSGFTTL